MSSALRSADDRLEQARRDDEPGQAQPGHERLRRGAAVGDAVGRERLQRADGLAVVAELAVEVVLDDQPPLGRRPRHGGGAALAREHDARRELVRGREHGRRASPSRSVRAPRPSTAAARSRGPRPRRPRGAAGAQGSSIATAVAPAARSARGDEREAVAEARADDHEIGIGAHPAGAREIRRELLAQVAGGRAGRRSRAMRPACSRSPCRSALIHAACGNDVRSGRPGLKLKRAARRAGSLGGT